MMSSNRRLTIALSPGGSLNNLGRSKNKTLYWDDLVEMLSTAYRDSITLAQYQKLPTLGRSTHKNRPGAFVGGSFSNGRRNSDSIEFRSVVTLDIDSHSQEVWEDICLTGTIPGLDGLAYQIHTTRSHTPEAPRLRVCLPLARDVSPEEYVPVLCAVAEMVDPSMRAVTSESFVAVQVMFLPSVCKDGEFFSTAVEGEFLDPDPLLEKYPVDEPELWPSCKDSTIKPFTRMKITHPEDKKAQAPIITALHRAYDPRTFIDEFLDHVYLPAGNRWLPVGASGAPSVRIYEDAFVQSDHGTDPARGQHNIFDLGRIHLFGHLDEDFDTDGMSLSEWPSYKAMCEWAAELPAVAEQLAEVEAEVEAERNQNMADLLDELDDDMEDEVEVDDLIGTVEKKPVTTIEEVLAKVKRSIGRASDLTDLERRLDVIRALPTTDFRELHRDLIAPVLQKKFHEITNEKITKATARKMLAPTVENLRAQAEGQELPDWLKPWVYLSQDNKFLHLDTKETLPKEGFNARFAKEAADFAGINQLGVAKLSAADLAWSVFEVPTPYTTRYLPGGPQLFEEEGSLYANSYRPAVVESGGYKGNEGVKLLKRLLEDLFPQREHRALVMDFLVHCVRYPERKLKYAMLIKGAENEGKTLLADLVAKLLGDSNCTVINSDMLREKYNGWAYEKLFCTIEEVKVPGREVEEVLNKLKPLTTNSHIPVRRMHKDATKERNFANLYLTTNDDDALRMEVDNTRYCVLFTRFRTNDEVKAWHAKLREQDGEEYPRKLWEHIHHRPAQFLEAFSKYKFSEFYDPEGRAPMTVFKKIMAEDGKTDERSLLETMLEQGNIPGITRDVLIWSAFKDELDIRDVGATLRNSAVGKFLKPLGFVRVSPVSLRHEGKVVRWRAWTANLDLIDDHYNWTEEGRERLLEEIERMQQMDDDDDLESLL